MLAGWDRRHEHVPWRFSSSVVYEPRSEPKESKQGVNSIDHGECLECSSYSPTNALQDRKADLHGESAPGLTLFSEQLPNDLRVEGARELGPSTVAHQLLDGPHRLIDAKTSKFRRRHRYIFQYSFWVERK